MALSPTSKKILYTVLLLLVTIAIGYLLYIVFIYTPSSNNQNTNGNRNITLPNINELLNTNGLVNTGGNTNANSNANGNQNTNQGGTPQANGGATQTTVLTPNTVTANPTASTDGSVRYYDPNDGKFYRVDKNGNITALSDVHFNGVSNVVWGNSSNQVIMEFPDGSNVYYNIDTKRQVTLPKEFEEMDFSPSDNQIAFLYMHQDTERRVLAVSSPDGSGARTLESLGQNADHVMVDWSPTGKVAASYFEFIDANRQTLGFVGLNNENFKGTVVEGRGLRSQYTPNGKQLLYSTYSAETDYKPGLWVVDADGDNIGKNRKEIQLNTFADKCTISNNSTTAYCGVPIDQKNGYGLDDRLLEGVPDELYAVDLNTGARTRIAVPVDSNGDPVYSMQNLVVTSDESTLYFRDVTTGKIVKISLK
ncbi:MAG: hypothetical protein KIH62_001385 [Candidatus Kerfeldbacteria bacterium]|nr:hypothetical protein [Candidatus Kerfeldbacteria bacterium]